MSAFGPEVEVRGCGRHGLSPSAFRLDVGGRFLILSSAEGRGKEQ